jgi:hypothetical protein
MGRHAVIRLCFCLNLLYYPIFLLFVCTRRTDTRECSLQMAEQGWNFDNLDGGPFAVHDIDWTPDDLNGGPWNDYGHMNANELGDNW